jgi:glycosyltransferase involved in cell wall biosynthesis
MKVYIPTGKNPRSGKGSFCNLLFDAMQAEGFDVCSKANPKCRVALHVGKVKKRKKIPGIPIVRLDGVWYNLKQPYKLMNRRISRSISSGQGFVFQSKYAKKLCKTFLSMPNHPTAIIPNGAPLTDLSSLQDPPEDRSKIFLAFARWRPHKRLKDTIESFLLADIPDSRLCVFGNMHMSGMSKAKLRSYRANSRLRFFGFKPRDEIFRYLKVARAVVHLCWLDCCPNSVVEAICAGKTVISNNVGGTPEIVEPSGGIVCKIDTPFRYKPLKLYNPPKIKRGVVANAMTDAANNERTISAKHLDIREIARRYQEFFRRIVQ